MALDVYFKDDIAQSILAGVVLAIRTAQANEMASADYVSGILAMAEHQALTFGVSWLWTTGEAQAALGASYIDLFDQAASRAIVQR